MAHYDFASYCNMLTDKHRMDAYTKTLRETVGKDSVVLDLGSGTGFFSIFASRLGAKKVYAVETNSLVHLSKQFAQTHDCAGKIEFIDKFSDEIELEEKADILICDLHGVLPFYQSSISTIIDARERLLKPNAIMIPNSEKTFFAVCEVEEFYKENISRYLVDFEEINMSSAKRLLTDRLTNLNDKKFNLLSEKDVFATVDYTTIEETDFSREMNFEISKKGFAHGLRGWFECKVGENAVTTNAPGAKQTVYGAPFFPFLEAVEVEKGDKISVLLKADFENGDYSWTWNTKIFSNGNFNEPKKHFIQSTTSGRFIAPNQMLKHSEFFTPKQNSQAKIDSFILNKMDGEMMSGDIADEIVKEFPDKFPTFEEALKKVSDISLTYSE